MLYYTLSAVFIQLATIFGCCSDSPSHPLPSPFEPILAWTWQRCGLKWQRQLKAIISLETENDCKPNNTNNAREKMAPKWPHFRHWSWFSRHRFNRTKNHQHQTLKNIKIKITPFHSFVGNDREQKNLFFFDWQ